jgi:hypothetical protein
LKWVKVSEDGGNDDEEGKYEMLVGGTYFVIQIEWNIGDTDGRRDEIFGQQL